MTMGPSNQYRGGGATRGRRPSIHPRYSPSRPAPSTESDKRKYTLLNELEPQDLGFFVRPTAVVEVCVLRLGS